jgi:hypothetical protein
MVSQSVSTEICVDRTRRGDQMSSSSTHKAVLRRFVHEVAAVALGAGLLAGLTTAAVLSTTPTPASAAALQTANCAFNGLASGQTTPNYIYNQTQAGVLVPFMLLNGQDATAGTTQISVVCTGLSALASDASLLAGVTNPIAGFTDQYSGFGTFGLNLFLGGTPSFVQTDNGSAATTTANSGTLGAASSGVVEAAYTNAAPSGTTLSFASSGSTKSYRTGSTSGFGFPVALTAGETLFVGSVGGTYQTVTVAAATAANATTITLNSPGLSGTYATRTPVVVPYTYTIPSAGAADSDATCPPSAAQVAVGLTNCAFAIADTAADEYGFGYVNFTGQPALPASTAVAGTTAFTNPPLLSVTTVSSSDPSNVGTSKALPGDTVALTSVSGASGTFWADPEGSQSEALQVEVVDSAGTAALLTSTDSLGSNTGNPAIVPDVYYPAGTSPTCGTTCSAPTTNGSGGSVTGGVLTDSVSTGNPNSAGEALDEVIPSEGYNAVSNTFEALAPGALKYIVIEPSVAPPGDGSYDTTAMACTTTCPLPGTSPISTLTTLSASVASGDTGSDPFTVLPVTALSGLPSGGIPPGDELFLNDPSGTGSSEPVITVTDMYNGATAVGVVSADPAATPGVPGIVNSYDAGADVDLTTIPNPEGAAGTVTGTLEAPALTSQTINFTSTAPDGAYIAGPAYTPIATATSGLTVALTIDPTTSGVCSISGGSVSFAAAGNCTIDANQAGNGTYAAATQVQQTFPVAITDIAPGTPTLNSAAPGSTTVQLSWSAPAANDGPAPEGYNVFEGTSTGGESSTPVNGMSLIVGTTYTVTGLLNSTKYFFTVDAKNPYGSSVASNELSTTTTASTSSPSPATVPDPPTALTAKAGNAQVSLSWTASFNGGSAIEGYNVYEGTTSGGESGTPVNGTTLITGTTYTVTGLTSGTEYFFTADAVNSIGSSGFSNEALATPTGPPSPTPPTDQCSSYTGTDAFLCAAYENLLGRAPDAAGLEFWDTELADGVSRTTVAYDIATSPEARDILVTSFYESFLNREPDSNGLSYWVGQLNGGSTDESVIAAIVGSPEFYSASGGTADGFLTASYEDLLGRAPDSAGLTYWEGQLSSGASPTSVIAGILSSTEYRTEFVEGLYNDLLGRAPDAAGLSYWVGQLASGVTDESVISSIIGSAEYYTEATS